MRENKTCDLLRLFRYPIHHKELPKFDKEGLALFSLLSHATNELNVIQRLMVKTPDATGYADVDYALTIQRHTLLRVILAKLWELYDELKSVNGKLNSGKLNEVINSTLEEFEGSIPQRITPMMRSIRNESTNHYKLKVAKKNLDHLSSHAELAFFVNKLDGNSYYPIGEEAMFMNRISRHLKSIAPDDRGSFMDELYDWTFAAIDLLKSTHIQVFEVSISSALPGRRAIEKHYWIDQGVVGDLSDKSATVFQRKHES